MDGLIYLDRQLLLFLNGLNTPWLDSVMMLVTKTVTWLPLECLLVFLLWRHLRNVRTFLLALVAVALVVLVADQFSSGFCKVFFCRFRPTHEPSLEGLVHIVDGYRGGMYGFISSHAANTFGVATFLALVFRCRPVTWIVFLWAFLCSYSRIYLGVHYPGDIICGALWGILTAYAVYRMYLWACSHIVR